MEGRGIFDKITLTVSLLGLVISFVGLTVSDGVTRLISNPNLVFLSNNVELASLAQTNGYVGSISIKNVGNAASKNLKLIFDFDVPVPKYILVTDEDLGVAHAKDHRLSVPMERLSSESTLEVQFISNAPITYSVPYIDDSGRGNVTEYVSYSGLDLLNVVFTSVIIISLLLIFWIIRRKADYKLQMTLDSHQENIDIKLRELREDIDNIEVVINEPSESIRPTTDRGAGQRLIDFISRG